MDHAMGVPGLPSLIQAFQGRLNDLCVATTRSRVELPLVVSLEQVEFLRGCLPLLKAVGLFEDAGLVLFRGKWRSEGTWGSFCGWYPSVPPRGEARAAQDRGVPTFFM